MCTPHRGMSGTINAIKAEPFASASAEASLEQLNGYGDYLAQDEHMADVGSSISATLEPRDRKRVFKISVDFGTTFSAVAFVNPFEDEEDDFELLHRDEVKCILNYPYDPSHYGGVRSEVPSETWYVILVFEYSFIHNAYIIFSRPGIQEMVYSNSWKKMPQKILEMIA